MSDRRGGHHVGGAGPDRARGDHDLAAPARFREGHCCQRHRLLVLSAPCRQALLDRRQRLRQAGDIAMTEDREYAGEQRLGLAVDLRLLRAEVMDQCLCHGKADGLHGALLLVARQITLVGKVGGTGASFYERTHRRLRHRHPSVFLLIISCSLWFKVWVCRPINHSKPNTENTENPENTEKTFEAELRSLSRCSLVFG